MTRRDIRWVLLVCLGVGLAACDPGIATDSREQELSGPTAAPPQHPAQGIQQATTSGKVYDFDFSGNRILWIDRTRTYQVTLPNGSHATFSIPDLYLMDRATGIEELIAAGDTTVELFTPAIAGDLVAWVRRTQTGSGAYDYALYLMDLDDRVPVLLSTTGGGPMISGTRVAFFDNRTGDSQLYVYDHASGSEVQIPGVISDASLDGNILTWAENLDPLHLIKWIDLDDPQLTRHSVSMPSGVTDVGRVEVSGQLVLFSVGIGPYTAIYVANLATGQITEVARELQNGDGRSDQLLSQGLSGSIGVWLDFNLETGESDLFAKDVFAPNPPQFIQLLHGSVDLARISGNTIAFLAPSTAGRDVFLYDFRRVGGPPMPPPRPPTPQPPRP